MTNSNDSITIPTEILEIITNNFDSWLNKQGYLHTKTFKSKAPQILQKWLQDNCYPYSILKVIKTNNTTQLDIPKCPTCGKSLGIDGLIKGKEYCSIGCVSRSTKVQEKARTTNLKKFGVEHPAQNGKIKEKMQLTNIKKYGSVSPFGNKTVQEKIKNTNIERYGDENPFRYGGKRFTELMVEKFGVEHPSQNEEVLQRMKTTNMERYGVDNASKVQSVKDKISRQWRSPYWTSLVDTLKNKHITVNSTKEEYLVDETLHLKCDMCNHEWIRNGKEEKYGNRPQYIVCPDCASKQYSIKEKEVLEFVKSLTNEQIVENDRTVLGGKELDILIPTLNLAIEFNGTYFHSTNNFKDISKTYHAEKTNKCREKGIRLIHIFEYEWDSCKEKIQNLIKSAIGVYDTVLYARMCLVKPISASEYCEFLQKYHLQSSVNSPIRFGLFYGNKLVSVIGFGQSRFEPDTVELHRYCVKSGYRIIGGFSKLIAHSNIKNFVTYVDMAHFDGNGYKTLGFIEESITPPNYVYVRDREVVSRYRTQKHKLKDFLGEENFDANLSEIENMTNNRWLQIYDSGQMKMRYIG